MIDDGKHKSPKTIRGYLESTCLLITLLDRLPESSGASAVDSDLARPDELADIAKSLLIAWINHLLSIHAPGIANNRCRAVQQWFNWLLNENEIDAHPMARMKPPGDPRAGSPTGPARPRPQDPHWRPPPTQV